MSAPAANARFSQRERIGGLRRELHTKRDRGRLPHRSNVIVDRVGVANLAHRAIDGLAAMRRAQIELDPSEPRSFHRGRDTRRRRGGGNRDATRHVGVMRARFAVRARQHR